MSLHVQTPHLALPFRFTKNPSTDKTEATVYEQDSIEEVSNCVEVIVRTPVGFRIELDTFGIPQPEFSNIPTPVTGIKAAINEWEERADVQVDENANPLDDGIADIQIQIGARD